MDEEEPVLAGGCLYVHPDDWDVVFCLQFDWIRDGIQRQKDRGQNQNY